MISCPANGSVDDVHPTTHPSIDDPLATNRLIERRQRMLYYHHTSGGVRPCVRVCCERASMCVCTCGRDPFVLAGARLCVRAAAGRYYCYYYRRRRRRPHIILYFIYSRQSRVSCYVSVCVPCPFDSFFFFLYFSSCPVYPTVVIVTSIFFCLTKKYVIIVEY